MGMGENKRQRMEYEKRVRRLARAVQELEECALDFPDVRDHAVELLENYSVGSEESEEVMKKAAQEIAAIGMLEIFQE